ncbi:MAG: multidrug efflux SMR transporter [Magnetococcales bacterium]|nr:multidrug efflux SMR transporter [Magnetococcales bacterium]
MKHYLLLSLAILSELAGTSAMKLSEGFTRLVPSVIFIIGYGLSFYLLALSLERIPVSTAYAIWAGVGTAGIAVIGVLAFEESLSPMGIGGIALIILGVILLHLSRG